MTAFHESTTPSNRAPGLGWTELVPRYLLVEDALRGRRVLELDVKELRSLIRLSEAGSTRVALQVDGADPSDAGVSLDASLAGPLPEPSHVIAVCGRIDRVPEDRTLVELPFFALEAMADAARSRAAQDVGRLQRALEKARL